MSSAAQAGRTILIVEDDASVRTMIAKALSASFRIVEASDGLHASELLTQMPPPSLVICDVMMPRVDGFSLVRVMRTDAKLRTVPILFLSARSQPMDVVQGIALGAKHYMTKPFKIQELVERVEKLAK
ncbi:MAG TPA: response regulator [Polyangiaceae bacterium]|jgi:DNA-binding response OmpR family regulator